MNLSLSDISNEKIQEEICILFKTMAYPPRIKILNLLLTRKMSVREIAEKVSMTPSAVSHQLKALRYAHLVRCKKISNKKYYELADEHIYEIYKLAIQHVKEDLINDTK